MPHQTKIATCSYCGVRQTLRPFARDGHELACSSCGAPLHEMKWLKPPKEAKKVKRSPRHAPPHPARPRYDDHDRDYGSRKRTRYRDDDHWSRRKKKRRKPMWKKALEEAFDVIEDIFD